MSMHLIRPCLPLLCVLAVACGDKGGGNTPDGPPPGDGSGVDTPVDNPIDMPPGGASRVWAVGDFLVDSARVAGAFDDGATLPFNTANPPPIVVPGGTSVLFSGTGSTANVFDARGDKIAFVADLETAGRFDLYVANKDGTSPAKLVEGVTGVEISSVQLSPDGTKVGFLMDRAAVDNGFDVYFVPTAGG